MKSIERKTLRLVSRQMTNTSIRVHTNKQRFDWKVVINDPSLHVVGCSFMNSTTISSLVVCCVNEKIACNWDIYNIISHWHMVFWHSDNRASAVSYRAAILTQSTAHILESVWTTSFQSTAANKILKITAFVSRLQKIQFLLSFPLTKLANPASLFGSIVAILINYWSTKSWKQ